MSLSKVVLVPDQQLTEEEKPEVLQFLEEQNPPIFWELGRKVKALVDVRIVSLYVRRTEPKGVYRGKLEGEIVIQQYNEKNKDLFLL